MNTQTENSRTIDSRPAPAAQLRTRARTVRLGRLRRILVGLIIAAGIVLAPLTTRWAGADPAWRYLCIILGTLLIGLGAAVRLWAGLYIGGRKERDLVTSGPYSCVRNPLYLGNLLAASGIAALTCSPDVFVFTVAATATVYVATIRQEQRKLLPIFGAAYDRYLREVPSLLPRAGSVRHLIHDATPCTITHRSLARELGRCSGLLALGLAAFLLAMNASGLDARAALVWHRITGPVQVAHLVTHHPPARAANHSGRTAVARQPPGG